MPHKQAGKSHSVSADTIIKGTALAAAAASAAHVIKYTNKLSTHVPVKTGLKIFPTTYSQVLAACQHTRLSILVLTAAS